MPDISGIELVKCLSKVPMIVFTTAYSSYAVEGFELDAIDYLLKPFSLARFIKSCNKAWAHKNLFGEASENYIFVKTGFQDEKVVLHDILYIEAEGNYLTFVLKERRLVTRQTMNDILQILPSDHFARVHRSYIISLHKIETLSRQEIGIAGSKIPIGASYEEKLQEIRASFIKH